MNPEKRTILPPIAFRGFTTRYRRPQLSEGFQDITEIAFQVRLHMHSLSYQDLLKMIVRSLSEARWNVRFGLDIGPDTPK